MDPYTIEFGLLGGYLGTRFTAASVREAIENNFNSAEKIIFDFAGVDAISDAFADESFGKLLYKFNMKDIKEKATFKNTDPFIRAKIAKAFKNHLERESQKCTCSHRGIFEVCNGTCSKEEEPKSIPCTCINCQEGDEICMGDCA